MMYVYKVGDKYFVRERKSPIMLGTDEEGLPVAINIVNGRTYEVSIIKLQPIVQAESESED